MIELSPWKKLALVVLLLFIVHCSLFVVDLFRADAFFNTGEKMQRYGLYEVAAGYYQRAINHNSREPRYHRELAAVLARLGMTDRAAGEAEIAYDLNPKNSLTIRSLISTYVDLASIDSRYLARAEELIAEAVDQQPTNPQLYYEQALIFLKAEKDEEAARALQKSLELKPDYQKARELLESSQHNPN